MANREESVSTTVGRDASKWRSATGGAKTERSRRNAARAGSERNGVVGRRLSKKGVERAGELGEILNVSTIGVGKSYEAGQFPVRGRRRERHDGGHLFRVHGYTLGRYSVT